MVKDRGSAGVDGNALAGIYAFLDKSVSSPPPPNFPDSFYYDIADRLEDEDELTEWRTRPRLFLLLYLAELDLNSDAARALLNSDVPDACIPLQHQLLPTIVRSDKGLLRRLQNEQEHVYSDREGIDKDPYTDRGYRAHWHIRSGDVYYEVEKALGSGGSGSVDKVQHRGSGRVYARKQLLRGAASTVQQRSLKEFELQQLKELEQRQLKEFDQELKSLKNIRKLVQDAPQLSKHFVDLAASYTDRKSFALLMCPVADCDLRALLSSPSLTSNDLAYIRTFPGCLAAAVSFLHEHAIRHKDIKPSNLLVKNGCVMLCDFGISRDYSDATNGFTTSGPTPFTRNYAAPEVIARGSRNASADIFSLGCCFLEIATVVYGCAIQEMAVWLEGNGDCSVVPALNAPGIASWILELQGRLLEDSPFPEDSPFLKWVNQMFNFPTMNISEVDGVTYGDAQGKIEVDRVTYGDAYGRTVASDLVRQINEHAKLASVAERFIGNCCCAYPTKELSPNLSSTITSPRLASISASGSSAHPSPRTRHMTTQPGPTSISASEASAKSPPPSDNATPALSDRSSQISRIQALSPVADSPTPSTYEAPVSQFAAPTERMDSLGISVRSIEKAPTPHVCTEDNRAHCCFTGRVTGFADRSEKRINNGGKDRVKDAAGGYGLCLSATGGPEVWKKAWYLTMGGLSANLVDDRAGFWLPCASFQYTLSDRTVQLSWFNSSPSRDGGLLSQKESSYRTQYHLREPNCALEVEFNTPETARNFISALQSPPANVSISLTPLLNQSWKHTTLSFNQFYLAQGLPILDHQTLRLDEGYRASDSGNAYTCSRYYAWRDLDIDVHNASDHAFELAIRNLSSTIYQSDLQRLSVPLNGSEQVTEQASLVRDVLKLNTVKDFVRSSEFIKLSESADITQILTTLTMWRPIAVAFPSDVILGPLGVEKRMPTSKGFSVILWRKGSDDREKPTISVRVRSAFDSEGNRFLTGIASKVGEGGGSTVYLDVRCFREGPYLDIRDMTASATRHDVPSEIQQRLTFQFDSKARATFLKFMKDVLEPPLWPTDRRSLAQAKQSLDPNSHPRKRGFRERLFGAR